MGVEFKILDQKMEREREIRVKPNQASRDRIDSTSSGNITRKTEVSRGENEHSKTVYRPIDNKTMYERGFRTSSGLWHLGTADRGIAPVEEGAVAEEGHDQWACPAEAFRLVDLACQDAVPAAEAAVLLAPHILVVEPGNRQVRQGWEGDPDQVQSLAGVGNLEEDDHQGHVRDQRQVVHADPAGRGWEVAVVGVLDAADQLGWVLNQDRGVRQVLGGLLG